MYHRALHSLYDQQIMTSRERETNTGSWKLSHWTQQSFRVNVSTPVCTWGFGGLEVKAAKCTQLIGGRALLKAHSFWPQFVGSFHLVPFTIHQGNLKTFCLMSNYSAFPYRLATSPAVSIWILALKVTCKGNSRLGSTTDGKCNLEKSLRAFEPQFLHRQNKQSP